MVKLEITVKELLSLINPNIIDIRSREKYNDNHLPNAINVDPQVLISNTSKYLDRNKVYYIYCQKGITSMRLVQLLRAYGYNVLSVRGGYEAWILEN